MSTELTGGSKGWYFFLVCLAIIVYITALIFNGLAASGSSDIFISDVGTTSDVFRLEITPANWTFFIWTVIFTWLALWLLYLLVSLCRMYDEGTAYVFQINVTPMWILVLFILNNFLIVGWLFAFDREEFVISLVLIVCLLFTIIGVLAISYVSLNKRLDIMEEKNLDVDIWLVRLLLQNGFSFYGGWVFVATMLNLGIALAYEGSNSVSISWSSTTSLILVSFLVPLYFILDVTLWSKYTLYTFAIYLSLIWAFVGILAGNFDLDNAPRNSILSLVLLIVISVFLLVKALMIISAHCVNSKVVPLKQKPL